MTAPEAIGNQRHRALIGLLILGYHQGAKEYKYPYKRPNRKQYQPEIECRLGCHWHI